MFKAKHNAHVGKFGSLKKNGSHSFTCVKYIICENDMYMKYLVREEQWGVEFFGRTRRCVLVIQSVVSFEVEKAQAKASITCPCLQPVEVDGALGYCPSTMGLGMLPAMMTMS